jgi:hypothetical protein
MVNKSLTEIFKNIPGDESPEWEQSFYGYLSEYGEWDLEKFWVFHKALVEVAKEVDSEGQVDRELSYALLYIQQKVLTHISSHFNPAIEWQFTSINDDQLYELQERFELAILGAISGQVIDETSFDTLNPLLSNA